MRDTKRLKWTRRVVVAGMVLGFASYPAAKLGLGELYPFAHWRLYSAPIGINEPANTFRIYSIDSGGETWRRHSPRPTDVFTLKEQTYLLRYWSQKTLKDSAGVTDAKERLRLTARSLAPQASRVRVVEETFYALPLYEEPSRYDTSTVATFAW